MNAPVEVVAAGIVDQGHFKGIAVVIDDEVHAEAEIRVIVKAIEDAGGHVVKMTELPQSDLDNFAGAAFFVLDWNLTGLGHGVAIPEALAAAHLADKIAFLIKLREARHAPVFIFTNEKPEDVKAALDEHLPGGSSNILIKQKTEVGANVYEVLNAWARDLPSVMALKSWERANNKAVNSVFRDLHDKDPFWPVFFWKTFKEDAVVPADELGRLITRLVASRMHPPVIDLAGFLHRLDEQFEGNPQGYATALMAVLEGERFLRKERLDPNSFTTGDVFVEVNQQGKTTYLLNVRAECDCIKRENGSAGHMYLLTGEEDSEMLYGADRGNGLVPERDTEAVVVAMCDGKHIRFKFKPNLKVKEWSNAYRDKRIGRLLPPFLTRLLERYAAYLQRPGIPRVPAALFPTQPTEAAAPIDECAACEAESPTAPESAAPAASEPGPEAG